MSVPVPGRALAKGPAGTVAAVDLGATSGRVILGTIADGGLRMRHVARFANDPVQLPDGLHWNALELYQQVLGGLAEAERQSPGEIISVGIDSWAVDYGLLRGGALLGVPYHYRDERTAEGVKTVHAQYDPAALYRRNGLQHLPFNTVFQLACEQERLELADRLLLMPDLLAYWLTGVEVAERTNASTTGLLNPRDGQWDSELLAGLKIPQHILPGLVDAGTSVGPLRAHAATVVGRALDVVTVGSHDTASAVVAVPNTGRDFAYISCGTWGLVGLELDEPVFSDAAREANFTNEGGVDGRIRFLHNVMGLWLLSESVRSWDRAANSAQRSSNLEQLLAEAAAAPPAAAVFDVNDPRFMAPGDLPARIAAWYAEHDLPAPVTHAQFARAIIDSLAQAFADSVLKAAELAGRRVEVIHIVGGGAQNKLLCQATADRSGLPVLAGPVEATAVGNILVQARTAGLAEGGLAELRELVAQAFTPVRHEPRAS
ncbi:rhamnulokinase [Kineosporia rhizophila]|uniref:rhamnulokinase n=1 Tax=Kineosporia TaxID=49184 RepID=UPI001E61B3AF|nr:MULTISPECIES: rhamnulokinase family protein [Kineosporia]MCE0535195.1 rhamnulokinase [Kineosporia rhizophila]GLY17029.1 rhamnulokinase [Kineosporia sp. NBRC 101677]